MQVKMLPIVVLQARLHTGLFSAFEVLFKHQSRLKDYFLQLHISIIGSSQSLVFCGCMYFLFQKRTIAVPGLPHLQIESLCSSFLCPALLCTGEYSLPPQPAQKHAQPPTKPIDRHKVTKRRSSKPYPWWQPIGLFAPNLGFNPPFSICTFYLFQNNEQTVLQLHKPGTFHFPCHLRDTINTK